MHWLVTPIYQRFKSLAQLGHLPKYAEESARARLYGKLLVALLIEEMVASARFISPWGYPLAEASRRDPSSQRDAA